jgi:hypothetical protein
VAPAISIRHSRSFTKHLFLFIHADIDGERCGDTLQSLFENAKDPDKVIVGLIEQNEPLVRVFDSTTLCMVG